MLAVVLPQHINYGEAWAPNDRGMRRDDGM